MLIVPRQLQRAGMTGDVPYAGGRLTPWHVEGIKRAAAVPPSPEDVDRHQTLDAMRHLLERRVISQQEYDDLVARVHS